MDDEPPLGYLLDDPIDPKVPAGPGREVLVGIVGRSRRHRAKVASVGMAATLVLGGAGGWFAGLGSGGSSSTSLAAGSPATTAHAAKDSAQAAGGGFSGYDGGVRLTKKFVRTTTDGVTIRAYQPPDPPKTDIAPGCATFGPSLQVEVSTADVAGEAYAAGYPGSHPPFTAFNVAVIGVAEGAPVLIVTTETPGAVATVRATFADGKTDQMATMGGWAALAHVAADAHKPLTGTVEALDAAGRVIGTAKFPDPSSKISTMPNIASDQPAPAGSSSSAGNSVSGGAAGPATGTAVSPVPPDTPVTAFADPGKPLPSDAGPAPIVPCKVITEPAPAAGASTASEPAKRPSK